MSSGPSPASSKAAAAIESRNVNGADDEGDIAQAREDLCPCGGERGRARGARGIRARHPRTVPAERLRECRAGDIAGIAVADRVRAGDELDIAPLDPRVRKRG